MNQQGRDWVIIGLLGLLCVLVIILIALIAYGINW